MLIFFDFKLIYQRFFQIYLIIKHYVDSSVYEKPYVMIYDI
jgi:hypothetical protein